MRTSGIELDDTFWEFVGNRPITHLDLSNTTIQRLNLSSFLKNCKNLGKIYARGVHILSQQDFSTISKRCERLRHLDISGTSFPHSLADKSDILTDRNIHQLTSVFNLYNLSLDEVFIYDGKFTRYSNSKFEKVFSLILNTSNTEILSLKRNNINKFNLTLTYKVTKLKMLLMSENEMTFLSPQLLSSISNIEILDLSKICNMSKEHFNLFNDLFSSLVRLRVLNLSQNHLSSISMHIFRNNKVLSILDLSRNRIFELSFIQDKMENLRHLNVAVNSVHVIEEATRDAIAHLFPRNGLGTIDMSGNILFCKECKDYENIDWFLSGKINISSSYGGFTCLNEQNITVSIALASRNLCSHIDATRKPVSSPYIVIPYTSILVIAVLAYCVKKRIRKRNTKANVLLHIERKSETCLYMVFLSFSSQDEAFVDSHILIPLNENLRRKVGLDKNLLCVGDRHFKPGRYIHDEIIATVQNCSVILVLLTESYCRSNYCKMEFEEAFNLDKPIIFMLKEPISDTLMSTSMKLLFQRNTRIHWKQENKQFVLKTSWSKICDSILERVNRT